MSESRSNGWAARAAALGLLILAAGAPPGGSAAAAPPAGPAGPVAGSGGGSPAGGAPDMVWTQSASELEALARSALPLRLSVAGAWTGQEIVVEQAKDVRTESGHLRFHLTGHVDPLGVPIDADPVLTLRFDTVKGVYVLALEALSLGLGPMGRLDLSKLIGPWEFGPGQKLVVPVRGGAGIGMDVTLRRVTLSPQGLRAEASVRYFAPPPPQAARR